MKGTIIDYNNSEAFVSLLDDTVITVPICHLSSTPSLGAHINIPNTLTNMNTNNYHNTPVCQKIIDFF